MTKLVALVATLLLTANCGGDQIDADTSCRNYLQAPMAEREQAVQSIAVDLEVSGAGSPFLVLNVDSICGGQLDTPIGDIVELQQY